ncbi:MAG: hypothetical protein U1E93_14405 [Alphaproteobacteria bacterium]
MARRRSRAHVHRARAWSGQAGGRRLHVLHVTTGDEIPLLAAAKDFSTAETTPQHLTLSAPECYERLGTYAQMNPPIRDESHRLALWEAVRNGVIDVIGSTTPRTRARKKTRNIPTRLRACQVCRRLRRSFWTMSTRAT